jgi:hypothetical protein
VAAGANSPQGTRRSIGCPPEAVLERDASDRVVAMQFTQGACTTRLQKTP